MSLKITCYAAKEGLSAKMIAKHSNHRTPLEVADMIEDLINLKRISDGNFNWMRRAQRVEMEGLLDTLSLCNRQYVPKKN